MLLLHEHATVTICHSRTRDLPAVAREVLRAGPNVSDLRAAGERMLDAVSYLSAL